MTEGDIYKILSDMIAEIYDWASEEKNEGKAIQYVMGLNDMARKIADIIREHNTLTEELQELMGEQNERNNKRHEAAK